MSRYRDSNGDSKVYVGDLPRDATEKELDKAFSYYGPLKNVWVARNPPGFAFIEFEDPRDAEDAIRATDGTNVCGCRVRVELSTGKSRDSRPKPWMRGGPQRMRRPFDPNDKCYECGGYGHYAYDCNNRGGGARGSRRDRSRSRSRSRSGGRRRSYSRSRSRSRDRRRSRSKSYGNNGRSRSRSRSPARRTSTRSDD